MSELTRSEEKWTEWMDRLAEEDFVAIDDFISDEMFRSILAFFYAAEGDDKLKRAGIGTGGELQVKDSVRGDFIYWLDRQKDAGLTPFFDLMDELIEKLKRYCYLSLTDSEFHIAKYPTGSHYNRHLDQFQERSNRQITVLIYLNENCKYTWFPLPNHPFNLFNLFWNVGQIFTPVISDDEVILNSNAPEIEKGLKSGSVQELRFSIIFKGRLKQRRDKIEPGLYGDSHSGLELAPCA